MILEVQSARDRAGSEPCLIQQHGIELSLTYEHFLMPTQIVHPKQVDGSALRLKDVATNLLATHGDHVIPLVIGDHDSVPEQRIVLVVHEASRFQVLDLKVLQQQVADQVLRCPSEPVLTDRLGSQTTFLP